MKNLKFTIFFTAILLSSCYSAIPAGYKSMSNQKYPNIIERYDEFKDKTFYRNKSISGIDNIISVYAGFNKTKFLRLEASTGGSNWIFFDEVILLNSQKEKITFNFDSLNRQTAVSQYGVSEKYDTNLSDSKGKEFLKFLSSNNGNISVRISGKKYREYKLTTTQVVGLMDILNFYFNEL